jgi:outer membrane protein insertion porin family
VLPRRHPTVPFAHAASLSVVAEARPSVKSSVKYTYTDDRRDHPFVPTGESTFCTYVQLVELESSSNASLAIM